MLELVARGEAAHAAHARALGASERGHRARPRPGGARGAARGVVRSGRSRCSAPRRSSRRCSRGGTARNVVPAEARAVLDCRTVPAMPPEALVARARAAVARRGRGASRDRLAAAWRPRRRRRSWRAPARARPRGAALRLGDALRPGASSAGRAGDQGRARARASARTAPDEFVLECELAEALGSTSGSLDELAIAAGAGSAAPSVRPEAAHEPTLGQGRAARRAGPRLHGRRGPCARRPPGAARRARLDRPRRDARARAVCSAAADFDGDPRRARGARRGARARRLAGRARRRGRAHARSRGGSPRASARPASASTSAARATTRCSPRCGSG